MNDLKPGLLKMVECINIMLTISIAGGFIYIHLFQNDSLPFDITTIIVFAVLGTITVHSLFTLWITQTKYPDKEITSLQLFAHYLFFGLTILALLIIGGTFSVVGYTLWKSEGMFTLKGYILTGMVVLSGILLLLKSLSCFLSYRMLAKMLNTHRYDI